MILFYRIIYTKKENGFAEVLKNLAKYRCENNSDYQNNYSIIKLKLNVKTFFNIVHHA